MTSLSMRVKARQWAEAVLPLRVTDLGLRIWRHYYWSRRRRIDPGTNRRVIKRYLESRESIKLELGSSKRPGMEDWIASDLHGAGDIQLDFTQPIPFPDNSVDVIYSSHVLEHFSYPHPMLDLLQECRRILKPGGTFSIAVPNARIFLDAYANPAGTKPEQCSTWDVGLTYRTRIDYVNFIAYMGGEHKHLFDVEGLLATLGDAGFADVRERAFDPTLDLEVRRAESIYATARKEGNEIKQT